MSDKYEKHTTHTDALDTLGTIIGDDEKRDAIHLAVEPVKAAEELFPGDHVAFNEDGLAVKVEVGKGVGIVDPFLEDIVEEGQRFWLVVYPRQISSLRHVWEHPKFKPSAETEVSLNVKTASELWLRNWVASHLSHYFTLENVIEAIETGHWKDLDDPDYVGITYNGNYITSHGYDASGPIPPEFWDHVVLYTGKMISTENRATYLGCSC
jgi:hypothetical protein